MLYNYITISYRSFQKNTIYTLINILSLTIGIAACIVIYMFISDELSFDSFHSKKSEIYRIYQVPHYKGNSAQKVALTMGWMGPALAKDFPEINDFTRYWALQKKVLYHGQNKFLIQNVVAVDSSFLNIFDFKLTAGDRATLLDEPNSVILTKETAELIFSNSNDAIGNNVKIQDSEYIITGVLENLPDNSHLRFDALVSISTFSRNDSTFSVRWDGSFLNTYLKLNMGTDIKALESKLPDFFARHSGVKDPDKSTTFHLQPLEKIHLDSSDIEHDYNNYRKFNGAYLKIFGLIGICILLIAGANFANLTTARASQRWKEIGLRKSAGANNLQIFGQFLFESALLALFSLILAVFLLWFLIPLLNQLIGRQFILSSLLKDPLQIGWFLLTSLSIGLITGIYPSYFITSFNVSSILKEGPKPQGKSLFNSSLIVLQFVLALGMIESTLFVGKQLSFMKESNPGFNKDQILLVDMNKEVNDKFEVLREEWLRNKFILGVTASGQRIGNNFNGWGFKVRLDTGIYQFSPSNVNVDYDYLKVYSIKLKEGRDFSRDFITDKGRAFIINETMVHDLNLKEPIGTPAGHAWYENDSLGNIIGVARDFNYNTFHHKIGMLVMVCHPEWGYDEISIKIDGNHTKEAIDTIQSIWNTSISSYPFSCTFLNDHFGNLYRSDQQMSSVVKIIAILAILISSIGLFGLVAIITNRRIKEIGIRKLNGARFWEILLLLNMKFVIWVSIAFVVASPLVWFVINKWLQNFAYRTDMTWWIFPLSGFLTLFIALMTVSWQTWQAARRNPIEALRYE